MRPIHLVRAAAVLYLVVLVTATHWPALEIEGPVARTDLYIHVAAFGLLTLFVTACGIFGPVFSARNAWRAAGAVLVFAALDEVTQGIPALARTPMLSDWAADAVGAVAAAGGWTLLTRLASPAAAG